jgi:hypothetical protein
VNTRLLSVYTKKHGNGLEMKLKSEAESVLEFLEVLHKAGFACVTKADGCVLDGPGMKVKVARVKEENG